MNKKYFLLILILFLIIGGIYYFEKMKANTPLDVSEITTTLSQPFSKNGYVLAPELVGIVGYLNTDSDLKIGNLRGKIVLIDFWTYSCINCIRTLPYLKEWHTKYKDQGLVIIGVHTPEFEFEKDYENVKRFVEENDIFYPVVLDNDYRTWRAYNNRYWPRKYLIDADGYIRYDHIGEGAYEETEKKIQELLAEIGMDIDEEFVSLEDQTPKTKQTPELYAGYDFALSRGQNIGNEEGLQPGKEVTYKLPENLKDDVIYLEGTWKSNSDSLESVSGGEVVLKFTAGSVHVVADALDELLSVDVFIDEKQMSPVLIDEPKLYTVYSGEYGSYVLKLKVKKGFLFNAFTFGS